MIATNRTREKNIMEYIAREFITDRLGIVPSKENVTVLARYLERFEAHVAKKAQLAQQTA